MSARFHAFPLKRTLPAIGNRERWRHPVETSLAVRLVFQIGVDNGAACILCCSSPSRAFTDEAASRTTVAYLSQMYGTEIALKAVSYEAIAA